MSNHNKINYIEFPVKDIGSSKDFFQKVFGWTFQDYGQEYTAIENAGIDSGMFLSSVTPTTEHGSVLVVMYSHALEETQSIIESNNGIIVKPIFTFPGGRRFHFKDLNGNEYAVWSDK